jgi:hypothetical protein
LPCAFVAEAAEQKYRTAGVPELVQAPPSLRRVAVIVTGAPSAYVDRSVRSDTAN